MSDSLGERVCALVHAGVGLQTRIYRLGVQINSNKFSFFKDSELDKVRRALDKHFPKKDAAMKEKGWERIMDKALARVFLAELVNGYEILKDCAKFKEVVVPVLRSTASAILNVVGSRKDQTPPPEEQYWPGAASRAFLDLICLYAKISVQLEKLGSDLRILVSGYNAACAIVNDTEDFDYDRVSNYVKLFEEGHSNPGKDHSAILRTIALELMENGDTIIADVISYLLEFARALFLPTAALPSNVWAARTAAACMFVDPPGAPVDLAKCAPVCYRERARGWIVWCFLACPAAIASSRGRYSEHARHEALLKTILNEIVVEPVFRDVVVRVHEEYYELFSWFPSKNVAAPIKEAFEVYFVAQKNTKRFVRECSMECINRAALMHRERRIMLTQMLLSTTYQLQSNPALMGPKGAAVVALLSAAKDELQWYFTHVGQPPPKLHSSGLSMGGLFGSGDTAKYVKEDWFDHARVGTLLSCHERLFDQARSLWWILEQYMFETVRGYDLTECHNRRLQEHADLLQKLQAPPYNDVSKVLFSLRLLELRHEVTKQEGSLFSSSTGSDFFLPSLFFHLQLLGDGYVGGDGENELEGITDPEALRLFASLGNLFFFHSVFMEAFEDTLQNQVRHCMGFLDLLSSVQDTLHPYAPEDEPWLDERTNTVADNLLKRIQERLHACLDELAMRRAELDAQTDPIRAAERLSRLRERKRNKRSSLGKDRSDTGLLNLDHKPGFESRPSARADVAPLAAAQRALRGISAAFGRRAGTTILIWRRGFVLREFFRESLVKWVERRLKSMCLGGPTIPRPCIILEQCLQAFEIAKFACEHAGFDGSHFIRQAWIRETSGDPNTVVDIIGQWLLKFVEINLSTPGSCIVFSELTRGFIKAPELEMSSPAVAPPSPGGMMRAEMWLDQTEVHALAAFLGRRGTGFLIHLLRQLTAERMTLINRWLFEDEAILVALKRGALSGEADLVALAVPASHSQNVVHSLRSVGAAVVLADMLKEGLIKCCSGLYAENFNTNVFGNMGSSPQFQNSTFSYAVAASLCTPTADNFWKQADVVLRLDAHANNAHLVARAVCGLLRHLHGHDMKTLRVRELEFFQTFGAMVLCLKHNQMKEFADWPLRGATLFLEKVVLYSSALKSADLDVLIPFPLRQAAVLDRSLQRVTGRDVGFSADEFAKRSMESAKQLAEEDAAFEEGHATGAKIQ